MGVLTIDTNQPPAAAPSALRLPLSAFPISAFQHARPRPRRRNLETGAHPQRPRQPSLRPDPSRDRPNVANRPAPDAYPAAFNNGRLTPSAKSGNVGPQ